MPRPYAGLADAHKFQGRWEEAEPLYTRSVEMPPENAENHLDYGEYLHQKALCMEQERERSELLREARRQYAQSSRISQDIPETYAMYGATFLVEEEDVGRGLETLEHAHSLLRSDVSIQLLLARLYQRLGRADDAARLLETAAMWSHTEEEAKTARQFVNELAGSDRPEWCASTAVSTL